MRQKKLFIAALVFLAVITGSIIYAADHIDAPAVTSQSTDITDLYVFRGQDAGNLVFVANTQGLLSPGATSAASFDENTLIEFNIDNNNDKIEDLAIQCKYDAASNAMLVYGPYPVSEPGTMSKIQGQTTARVAVTAYGDAKPKIGTGTYGIKVFAGPRDDPFFFDLNRYKMILAGTAPGFNNPGTDAFAGTNVLSTVVEVPKFLLGNTNSLNVWVETKKKM
ncbi:DUF4331 family protein [Ferruginibacter sp. SUN002]|uniref:DUF4331 family protein n=1 Tax=Ferruginibacter sp. SUN002 TaxID=2937789 RepID=UPI003D35CD22